MIWVTKVVGVGATNTIVIGETTEELGRVAEVALRLRLVSIAETFREASSRGVAIPFLDFLAL